MGLNKNYNTPKLDNFSRHKPLAILCYRERIPLQHQNSTIQKHAESHTLTIICGQQRNHNNILEIK